MYYEFLTTDMLIPSMLVFFIFMLTIAQHISNILSNLIKESHYDGT